MSQNIEEEEIIEDHQSILQKRSLIRRAEEEILQQYKMKNKMNELDSIPNSDSAVVISKFNVVTSASTTNIRQVDEDEPYQNPNLKNDLSQMNISHLSHNDSQMYNNAPGQYIEGRAAKHIFGFITNEDYQGLLVHLKSGNYPVDLMNMQDSRRFSVLTYAAYRNDTKCFKVLFEYAWKHSNARDMRAWVNQTTDDEFTALHFATKHGNYTMLTLLVEKGKADLYITNKYGAMAMHIAAQ